MKPRRLARPVTASITASPRKRSAAVVADSITLRTRPDKALMASTAWRSSRVAGTRSMMRKSRSLMACAVISISCNGRNRERRNTRMATSTTT